MSAESLKVFVKKLLVLDTGSSVSLFRKKYLLKVLVHTLRRLKLDENGKEIRAN